MRGIITLHALAGLEAFCGRACSEIFDCFAGTSTGAIIAAGLAFGYTVCHLIQLYREQRDQVFSRTLWSYVFGPLATRYRKAPVRELLQGCFGDCTLEQLGRDIVLTATDTTRGEAIFFTSFWAFPRSGPAVRVGRYQGLRLSDVVEASMSAPTYFAPTGRFIDGGVGVYNNPAYIAAVEALRYSSDPGSSSRYVSPNCDGVDVFSFGAGAQPNLMKSGQAAGTGVLGWAKYVIGEGMAEAGRQQNYVAFHELDQAQAAIRFYRYQLYLADSDPARRFIQDKLRVRLPDFPLSRLKLDAIDEERFNFMDDLGHAWGKYLHDRGFGLTGQPLVTTPYGWDGWERRLARGRGVWCEAGALGPAPAGYPTTLDQELRTGEFS